MYDLTVELFCYYGILRPSSVSMCKNGCCAFTQVKPQRPQGTCENIPGNNLNVITKFKHKIWFSSIK